MNRQPSVVVIARHGARLDQGDKDWHLTAEKPYDPPLSYGGWIQSQSLGSRIAAELDSLDLSEDNDTGPRKRRKIILHSSPYLRCIQTSIGIAAGLHYPQQVPSRRPIIAPIQRSSLSKPPMGADDEEEISPQTSKPEDSKSSSHEEEEDTEKTELKLDAFLGEWLSSGYFTKTKPPPSSDILISEAKEFLRKPPEEIRGADLARTSIQEFPDLDLDKDDDESGAGFPPIKASSMRSIQSSLPQRSRTLSFGKNGALADALSDLRHHRRVRSSTYSPPVPMYSIAPKDAIPVGFVAHAREACVAPDFQWDSQLSPLQWGDGGQYEEEWSTMHRRFRDGLQQMLHHYSSSMTIPAQEEKTDEDEDEDIVLVIVTHQAGCNALIRLITSAPALYDVGTASLTMAVRKPYTSQRRGSSANSSTSPSRPRRGSLDLGLAEEYDMKIIASTEHLRSGSNPLGLNSPNLGASPAFASRRMAGADSAEGFSIGDSLGWRSSSHQGLTRSSSVRSHGRDSMSSLSSVSGSGLWGTKTRTSSFGTDGSIDPKFGSTRKNTTSIIHEDEEALTDEPTTAQPDPDVKKEQTKMMNLPVRTASMKTASPAGLWGGPDNTTRDGLWANSRSTSGSFRRDTSPAMMGTERKSGMRRWTAAGH